MQNVPKIVLQRLRAMTPAVNHPDADVLAAFAERSLPEVERTAVLEHMARCGDCRDVVALALPEVEPVGTTIRPSPSIWTWPALRWGFVAAGIVAIAAFSVVQYQRHSQASSFAGKQSPNLEVAANEPKKQELAQSSGAAPAEQRDKPQSPAVPAFADSVAKTKAVRDESGKNEDEKKIVVRVEASPAPATAPTTGAGANSFHGAPAAGQLSHGPRLANQWPQQNLANNISSQVSTAPPPAAFAKQQAASEGGRQAQNLDLEAAAQPPAPSSAGDAFPSVARAKAAPMQSGAEAATIQPSLNQGGAGLMLQGAPGQLRGYVVDPTGAAVANARITITPATITSAAKGAPATAVTNSAGTWLIAGLPTGSYKAQAEAPGFRATVLDLNYDANQPSMYGFTLNVGNVSETVEVSGASTQLQTEAASVGSPITNSQGGQTAVNGRSFDSLSALAPAPRWSVTSAGGLQRSIDQGKTWQAVDVNASPASFANSTSVGVVSKTSRATKAKASEKDAGNQSFGAVTFHAIAAAGSEVWAGGNAGALYHSVDSGSHWTRVAPAVGELILTGDIIRVDFPDAQHGSVSTSTSEVWHTNDDGQTWQKQ